MKKNLLLNFLMTVGLISANYAQVLHSVHIQPIFPAETDTLYVISDITYTGACDFGLVEVNTWYTDTTVFMMPLYCGYWDSTVCNRVDTFKINPLASGEHLLNIDYHQGSVCPYSDFDATIAHFDTLLIIGNSGINTPENSAHTCSVYPNPTSGKFFVESETFEVTCLKIYTLQGKEIVNMEIHQKKTEINHSLPAGIYYYEIKSHNKSIAKSKLIIQ